VNGVEDAASHRFRPDLDATSWDEFDAKAPLVHGSFAYTHVVDGGWCRDAYEHMSWYVVQSFGLTDPFMSHLAPPRMRFAPGHRWGLTAFAEDLSEIRRRALQGGLQGATTGTVFDRAVRDGTAPPWIRANLAGMDAIEARVHRAPSLGNVFRAFDAWPRIEVSMSDVWDAVRRSRARRRPSPAGVPQLPR